MFHTLKKIILILGLLALAATLVYQRLDDNHKRFVRNFISQIPDLPGRYMV